jgi:aerobic-type carbon monoxide dehydrogenase small subunit (CoxS/CutS family)
MEGNMSLAALVNQTARKKNVQNSHERCFYKGSARVKIMKEVKAKFTVDKRTVRLQVKLFETLPGVLLTGACSLGACGGGTIILDETPVRSCLALTPEVEGVDVTTTERLQQEERPHPLQKAFTEKGGPQCGFGTSGMIMIAKALPDRNPGSGRKEIFRTISYGVAGIGVIKTPSGRRRGGRVSASMGWVI